MAIIAQMVGRNEADRYLEEVLDHLRSTVSEIVFTDDCSDDNTAEVAAKYGAHVYKTDEPLFGVHEGQLRNQAWKNLTNHASVGDWILCIDCDEKLWSKSPDISLSKLTNQPYWDVLNIRFYHMWNRTHYRVDKLWRPTNSFRLFRYFHGGKIADRQMACGSEPTYVQTLIKRGKYLVDTGLMMQHLGYVNDEDKQSKYDRYMSLDGGSFHLKSHIESIIDPEPQLEPWN